MKKIITLLAILISFMASAQHYTYIAQRYDWLAGKFRALQIPYGSTPVLQTGQSTDPGQVFFNTSDSLTYVWTGYQFVAIGSSGSIEVFNGLSKTGDTIGIGGSFTSPAIMRENRAIDLGDRSRFYFVRGDTLIDEGFVDWEGSRNAPLGAVIIDSVQTTEPDWSVLPRFAGDWGRVMRWTGGIRAENRHGWRFRYRDELSDSVRLRGNGGDHISSTVVDKQYIPLFGSTTKRLVISGHGTNSWLFANEGIPAFITNNQFQGNSLAYIYAKGYFGGIKSYLLMTGIKDTIDNYTYIFADSYMLSGTGNHIKKAYFLRNPSGAWANKLVVDSAFWAFDTLQTAFNYLAGNTVIGKGTFWSHSRYKLAVNGNFWTKDSVFSNTRFGTVDTTGKDILVRDRSTGLHMHMTTADLGIGGGLPLGYIPYKMVFKNSDYTVEDDVTHIQIYGGPAAITLPDAGDWPNRSITISSHYGPPFATTNNPAAIYNGGGSSNTTMLPGSSYTFVSDGTNWNKIRLGAYKLYENHPSVTGESIFSSVNGDDVDDHVEYGLFKGLKGTAGIKVATVSQDLVISEDRNWARTTSNHTLVDNTTDQPIFPSANDAWTVEASTLYRVKGLFHFNMGATTHTTSIGFTLGDGASVTRISIGSNSWNNAPNASNTAQVTNYITQAAASPVTLFNGATTLTVWIDGEIAVNAAGTITPFVKFSTATGGTVETVAGSFFEMAKIGTTGQASNGNVN